MIGQETKCNRNNDLIEENENLRRQLTDYADRDEIHRQHLLTYEREIRDLNDKYDEKLLDTRLNYETKMEQLTNRLGDQQMEIITLKQIYQTVVDEKRQLNEHIDHIHMNEQRSNEKLVQLQMAYDQILERNTIKFSMTTAATQTVS
jgi:chromosome segregation ATPase